MNDATQFFDTTASGGYAIERSIRLNSIDNAYCSRVFTTPTDQKKWTWSGWVKRGRTFANWDYVFVGNNAGDFGFYADKFYFYDSITATNLRLSTAVFRDLSAWYHLQVVFDSANSTVANRLRVYINGTEITTWDTNNNIGFNAVTSINSAATHYIGAAFGYAHFSGYLADIHFIDGQALDPTSFGEFDANGVWQPKAYTGTYGTNGFHLPFSDNSTAAALGTDTSGNGNTWSVFNLSVAAGAGNDSLVDTPTSYGVDDGLGGSVRGNYCTLNPLDGSPTGLSNGNLDAASANAYPTIIPGSGQWYYEVNGTGYQWDGTRANWTPRAGSHNFGQRAWSSSAPSGYKALCTQNLSNTTITTSGNYTGNGVADGPFVYLNGVPTAMTVNGNAVTFGTEADKLSNGFKVRTTSTTYNQNAATYNYSITSTGDSFKRARAQSNP